MSSMTRVRVDGKVLNKRTADMLHRVEQRLGYGLYVLQGSYNHGGVAASAGTHDGGGAVDISCRGINVKEVVKQMRQCGFAAWHRLPSQGPWTEHIHAIAIGDPELSSGAKFQVSEYYNERNGLASRRADDAGYRPDPIPVWPIALSPISVGRLHFQFTAEHPKKVPAVEKVQRLLNYRRKAGLVVDGVAGPKTRAAYKAWENHIHAPAADGIPGRFSVAKLVEGYYRVVA